MADLLRAAWRQIWRAPGFSLTVVCTLALTIGASTTLISVLNAVVLRSLPVPDPGTLVMLQPKDEGGRLNRPLYYETYLELARLPVFRALEMYAGGGVFSTEVNGRAGEGIIEAVTPGYYDALGIRPHLGRFFTEADAPGQEPASPVAVISYDFWQRYFGGDPAAVGSRMVIEREPVTVIGVTPPGFPGLQADSGFGFAVPLTLMPALSAFPGATATRSLQAIGRLGRDVSIEQARAAVDVAWPSLRVEAVPSALPSRERQEIGREQMVVEPIGRGFSFLRQLYRSALFALAGITVLLWVIGCTNLSGLFLSRLTARRRETAVCLAIGATRGMLVWRWLMEGLMLSLAGAALAYLLARAASTALVSVAWLGSVPLVLPVEPDTHVLLLMAGLALVTTVVMAVLPGWLASGRAELAGVSRSRATASSGRSRTVLLVVQVAISLVLLFGAGLFGVSLLRLRAIDVGMDTAKPRFTRLLPVPGGYDVVDGQIYYPALARTLEQIPGMRSIAYADFFPTYWNFPGYVVREGVAPTEDRPGEGDEVDAFVEYTSPDFFGTVGIPLLAGRDFTWQDAASAPPVAVVSESLAARLFPRGGAVGRHVRIGETPERSSVEIIGIARDAKVAALRGDRLPAIFRPRMQEPEHQTAPVLLYRADGDAALVEQGVREAVASFGHEYVRLAPVSLAEELDRVLVRERLLAWLSGAFAGLALLLVFIGLFAALAFAVNQRTREIGIRMAIGAPRGAVVSMIVREGLLVVGWGSAIGIVVSLAGARVTRSLVFDLDPMSPTLAFAAAGVFVLVAVAASLWPAHRAASVDPATVLRAE